MEWLEADSFSSILGFLALSSSWISYALHRWWQLTLIRIMSYGQFFLMTHVKKERLNESKFYKLELQNEGEMALSFYTEWVNSSLSSQIHIHDQFIFLTNSTFMTQSFLTTNSPFSPIHIHDQFIFLTDSCFKNYSFSKNAWILGPSIPSYWTSILTTARNGELNLAVGHMHWTSFWAV